MSIQIAYPEAEIADIQKLPNEIWLPPIVGERQRPSRGTASGNPWFFGITVLISKSCTPEESAAGKPFRR